MTAAEQLAQVLRREKAGDWAGAAALRLAAVEAEPKAPADYPRLFACITRARDLSLVGPAYDAALASGRMSRIDDKRFIGLMVNATRSRDPAVAAQADALLNRMWLGVGGYFMLGIGMSRWWPTSGDPTVQALLEAVRPLLDDPPAFRRQDDALAALRDPVYAAVTHENPWLLLAAKLSMRGYYHASHVAKTAAGHRLIERFRRECGRSGLGMDTVVAAYGYVGRAEEGLALLARSKSPPSWPSLRLRADLLMLAGQLTEARALLWEAGLPQTATPATQAFRTALAGHSVALVGPSTNALSNGAAIDAHDVVVRTNFYDPAVLARDAEMLGTRTDVSYYNIPQLGRRKSQIVADPAPFAVVRSARSEKAARVSFPPEKIRQYLSYKKRHFTGNGFAFRHVLFDLLLFCDRPVDVYGADFFLSAKPHHDGYFDVELDLPHAFTWHDVFDTFLFMQALSRAGAIRGDAILADILACDTTEFAHRLAHRCGVRN